MIISAPDKTMGLFWARFLNAGAILIPILFLHFCTSFLRINEKKKKSLITAYLVASIILVLNFTSLLIKDVAPKLFFNYYSVPGVLYPLYVVMLFSYIGYAFYLLIKEHKKAVSLKRNQLKYILIASTIGFGGATTLFLPVFDIKIPPLGYLFVSLYSVIVSYAIVKHRLMDINIIFKKGTIHTLLLTLIFIRSFAIVVFFVAPRFD
jgi:hypothetical protein